MYQKEDLVVCTVRLRRQVYVQTELKVLAYNGTSRNRHQSPAALAEYDIVLASYGIVRSESPHERDMALFR